MLLLNIVRITLCLYRDLPSDFLDPLPAADPPDALKRPSDVSGADELPVDAAFSGADHAPDGRGKAETDGPSASLKPGEPDRDCCIAFYTDRCY